MAHVRLEEGRPPPGTAARPPPPPYRMTEEVARKWLVLRTKKNGHKAR